MKKKREREIEKKRKRNLKQVDMEAAVKLLQTSSQSRGTEGLQLKENSSLEKAGGRVMHPWLLREQSVLPAIMSGTRASSMLSTRAMGVGWLRQSSESGAAEAEDAPGSTTTTSSIASKDTEDNCSPEKASTANYTCVHFPGWI